MSKGGRKKPEEVFYAQVEKEVLRRVQDPRRSVCSVRGSDLVRATQ